jgi:trigger factor
VEFEVKEAKVENDQLLLSVEVASTAVEAAYRTVRKELSRYVRIPGFRKGKTPLKVLANHIGKDRFEREIERELLPSFYYQAIEKSGYHPVSAVAYVDKTLRKGKPFQFTAKVMVAPKVELGDYREATFEMPEVKEVSDEDVQKRLDDLRVRASEPVEKEGEAEQGDLVRLDIQGKVGDKVFPSLSQKSVTLRIGDDGYFPDFDMQLLGVKKGDSRSFDLPAPEEVANPEMKDKQITFSVEIQDVQSVELPEVDESFLDKLGGHFNDAEELKTRIRLELEHEAQKETEEAYESVLQDMILGLVEVEPPELMLDERVEEKFYEFKDQFKPPYSFDDYLSEWNRTEEDVKVELREGAKKACQIEFALDEIAARESISASEEEVQHRLKMLARMLRRSPMEVEEMIDSSGSRVLEKQKLTREKVFGWLKARQAES